jgi:nucleolar protein 14
LDLTEELDKEWRNIMPLIGSMNKKLRDEENAKSKENDEPKPDDFDVLVRKLQFDPKGKVKKLFFNVLKSYFGN